MAQTTDWYDRNANDLARRYEAVDAARVHAWLLPFLPSGRGVVLDIGAGTGRDADWLASRGLDVVAVEPSTGLRLQAQQLHPSPSIQWVNDELPSLAKVMRGGQSFDLILLSAVWMHVAPADRARALRKLTSLLKPGGCIAITLRHGPPDADRAMYEVSQAEVESLVRFHAAFVEHSSAARDELGRSDVSWTQLVVRLPDDGTGALPLLRHIILNDDKSSTYKLALLRVLCRIADGAAGYARYTEDEHVSLPFGLVGLYWLRLFRPLLAANLPQTPTNRGDVGLGFVRDGFRGLMSTSHRDLRIGMPFSGERGVALHAAIKDACNTIARMPANFMTYPAGGPILPVAQAGRAPRPKAICLDEAYLAAFGELRVPLHLWRALQRFDVWIEPAIIAEWSRMMASYAEKQGQPLRQDKVAEAMTWSEPTRDVRIAREQALRLCEMGTLHCVWTGQGLSTSTLDIDHCLPWAAWPCDDLWNLLPAHRTVNQKQKREKLPSIDMLRLAQDRMQQWWEGGYLAAKNQALADRFLIEARASLPLLDQGAANLEAVFDAVSAQQVRLKHDQQVPIWDPKL